MSNALRTSIGLLLLSGATELVVFSNGQGPIRIGLTFAFLMVAPGWAILRLVDLDLTPSARVGLAVGISTGVEMAAASALAVCAPLVCGARLDPDRGRRRPGRDGQSAFCAAMARHDGTARPGQRGRPGPFVSLPGAER